MRKGHKNTVVRKPVASSPLSGNNGDPAVCSSCRQTRTHVHLEVDVLSL